MSMSTRVLAGLAVGLLATGLSSAGVALTMDTAAINKLLSAVTVQELNVPLGGQAEVTVQLRNLKVLGLEPPTADRQQGYILTSLQVDIPQFGLSLEVKPRLSLNVLETGDERLELRFERVEVRLPLGSLDLAPFLEPLKFPADGAFALDGASGEVEVQSRLSDVKVGTQLIRFEFTLDVPGQGG